MRLLPFLMILGMFFAPFFWNLSPLHAALICTDQYAPVCGSIDTTACLDTPCYTSRQTFGNSCMASNAAATEVVSGACDTPTPPVGGVRDSYGCYTAGGYVWDVRYRDCIRPWLQHIAILNIQSEKIPCMINGTSTGCLTVHNRLGNVPFFDTIAGFDFVPGFSYRLLLADQINESSSSRTYTLIRVLAKMDQTYTGLIGTRWNIVSLDGNLIDALGYITFSRGAVSGKLCNNFSGNYTIDWDTFSAPSIITTEMYCNSDIMQVENVFQLHGATYSLSGDYLTIRTRTDHVITWKRG